jgi:hypothetical protein
LYRFAASRVNFAKGLYDMGVIRRAIQNSLAAVGLLLLLITVTPLTSWWAR